MGGGRLLLFTGQQLLATGAGTALRQLGAEAERFNLLAQGGRGLHAGHLGDAGLLEGKVHVRRDDPRQRAQHLV
ncbi:hypothetical protein D3C79_748000 [compost metagenome]